MTQPANYYSSCLSSFLDLTKDPCFFLEVNEAFCDQLKTKLKEIYDFTQSEKPKGAKSNVLSQLIVKGFDLEQIWQQIELQNDSVITPSLTTVSRLVVNKSCLLFGDQKEPENEEEEEEEAESEDSLNEEENKSESTNEKELDLEDLKSEEELPETETPKHVKKSIVDDEFFKLDEMEKFLEAEEKKLNQDSGNDSEESESEESVDLFEGSDSESDDEMKAAQAKYKDFFVQKDKHLEEIEEKHEDLKSLYELKQERLKRKIQDLEEKAIEEKSWQLKGEITADKRPQNSLLEEVVDFDLSSRPAPVQTEQTTMQLEDIIKQRIKDRVFDSVERKARPVETPLEYKKKLVLDQEKSKESLAQIYEKEYLEQQANLNADPLADEKEPELHTEINKLMKELFLKLDALSNFHFTPKPAVPEIKIISNLPAISMEEVAPVAISDAALLAPEEIKTKLKGDVIGKNERSSTDKKRERRKKKLKQKIHAKIQQKKNVPGLGNKHSKEKIKNLLDKVSKDNNVDLVESTSKTIKSSKAFFSQLQDQVKSEIKRKSSKLNEKKTNVVSAKKLKL